jgi:tripartite-type tricarboxylate transporter receptor subunit TctC
MCGWLAALLAICSVDVACAQDFYAGKQVNMIVGSGVGGGYDAYARLVARHWAKYIPGAPNIVVQNMPAAGSLAAMNLLANSAPRDGTTVGQVQTHIGVEPLLGITGGSENAKYDGRQMNWIGSAAKEYPLVVMWHTAPAKSFRDLMDHEIIVGASGTATSDSVYARVLNELVGTRFRIIDGYKDNPSMILATETGEIMGRAGWFMSSLMSTQRQPLQEGKLRILAQVALEKHPELQNVPLVTEFISDPEKRRKLEFALSWLPMGRPFVAPPGVPADRVQLLRSSFLATLKDPTLLAEAGKQGMEISPMSGEEINALLDRLYATPPDVVAAVRTLMIAKK